MFESEGENPVASVLFVIYFSKIQIKSYLKSKSKSRKTKNDGIKNSEYSSADPK